MNSFSAILSLSWIKNLFAAKLSQDRPILLSNTIGALVFLAVLFLRLHHVNPYAYANDLMLHS